MIFLRPYLSARMPPCNWNSSRSAVVMAVISPMMVTEAPRLSSMYLDQNGFQPCCTRLHRLVVRLMARMFWLLNTSRTIPQYSRAAKPDPRRNQVQYGFADLDLSRMRIPSVSQGLRPPSAGGTYR